MSNDPEQRMRITEERDGPVLTLTLDYPARRNALAMPLRTQLSEILERAQTDGGTRAIVLTGSEGVFCSGGDISGMDVKTALDGRERMRTTHKLIRLMAMGSLPIVAAVEGWCVGGGLSIACAADTIVAAGGGALHGGLPQGSGLMSDLGLPHTEAARFQAEGRRAWPSPPSPSAGVEIVPLSKRNGIDVLVDDAGRGPRPRRLDGGRSSAR